MSHEKENNFKQGESFFLYYQSSIQKNNWKIKSNCRIAFAYRNLLPHSLIIFKIASKLALSNKVSKVMSLSLINQLTMPNFQPIIFQTISWNKFKNRIFSKKILSIKVITSKKNLMKNQWKVILIKIANMRKIFQLKMIRINLIIFE